MTVTVGSLKTYPPPASPQIQEQITRLWSSGKSFVVLSGPPGTGKTRTAEDYIAGTIVSNAASNYEELRLTRLFPDFRTRHYSDEEIEAVLLIKSVQAVWDICVLHPQYSYEDLIRGYRMSKNKEGGSSLVVREGILGFMSRVVSILEKRGNTEQDKDQSQSIPRGILVLDEINRAPLGQIFGEAIYALDRRGRTVSTPYELDNIGSSFSIPVSLLLLGTMNSVDRGVAGFDYALRRRLVIIPLIPNPEVIKNAWNDYGLNKVGTAAVKLYEKINSIIKNADNFGVLPIPELLISHSYFLPVLNSKDWDSARTLLAQNCMYQVVPLLLDYKEQGFLEYKADSISDLPFAEVLLGAMSIGSLSLESLTQWIDNFNDK